MQTPISSTPRVRGSDTATTSVIVPREGFWNHVFALRGAVTLRVMPRVVIFGLVAAACTFAHPHFPSLGLDVGPVEVAGGVLAMLLAMRSNAGYDRWYEARKLWGGIVNDVRALVTGGLVYGPSGAWRARWVGAACAFAHVTRTSLRGQPVSDEARALLGARAQPVATAAHGPSAVGLELAELLAQAAARGALNDGAHINLEAARMRLLACVGACERILTTPLPRVYLLKVRRFLALYLFLLPLALVDKVGWATPVMTMLVSYAALGMDQIAEEMENPFSTRNLNHLPLNDICTRLETGLRDLFNAREAEPPAPPRDAG